MRILEPNSFKKNVLKYSRLSDIIVLSISNYIKHLEELYFKYLNLNNKTINQIYKDFIDKQNNACDTYYIIRVLLFGDAIGAPEPPAALAPSDELVGTALLERFTHDIPPAVALIWPPVPPVPTK